MDEALRASVISAMRQAGGHEYMLMRIPLDKNGQPSGEAAIAGHLYGSIYHQRSPGSLSVDIPGISIRRDTAAHMVCMVKSGDAPTVGDIVVHGSQTAGIVDVQAARKVIYTLTLDKDMIL